MSREDLIKQVTILKMKENYKHDNEAFNLINFSLWNMEDDDNKIKKLDESSKIQTKILRSLK